MWYYTVNNQQVGPVDEKEIKKLIAAGTITHATMVWTTGMGTWLPIAQTALGTLMGSIPPPPVGMIPPINQEELPKVRQLKSIFLWFWISLAVGLTFSITGTLLSVVFVGFLLLPIGSIGLIASLVLFLILIHKGWKLVQHDTVRTTPDQAVANCFILFWNFYWFFPAFRGLAKEINMVIEKERVPSEPINLTLALWFVISLLAVTIGIGVIPFIVLWIIFTKKIVDNMIAIERTRN